MNSVLTSVRSLMHTFDGKAKEFTDEIENVHMVWLEEIQQEANRMFSRDFNAEPELMPKTPSQKKSRRKRLSSGHQEENAARRRFSKGKRSNLRGSVVKSLNLITEEEIIPEASTSQTDTTWQPKRTTRKNNNKLQTQSEVAEDVSLKPEEVQNKKPELVEVDKPDDICSDAQSPPAVPSPEVAVSISVSDRLSAERVKDVQLSAGRSATKIAMVGAARSSRRSSRRSSVRCSLKVRHSLAGLRHSMTQESVRRASRRSMLKRQVSRMGNSICSSNIDEHSSVDSLEEMEAMPEAVSTDSDENPAAEECIGTLESQIIQIPQPSFGRITRSVAANSAAALSPFKSELSVFTPKKKTAAETHLMAVRMSRLSQKRKAPDPSEESSTKKYSPPKKSASAMRPNMKSFLHTVQKNQLLMMTPNSLGRSAVFKSFIKQNTPLKMDPKTKERYKLEALQKKQEQEEERMKKMEEEKKKKHDELKRKRDERLKRVLEAKVKEEQREVEKKKKTEQKMIQIDERNDKRQVEENKKKKLAVKRQEDLEQRKKQEEEAKAKIQQAEEEKKQQELLAKKKAEEEEQRTRKLAEARRALELKREQERERLAAAEREWEEKEKALVLQRELERAAREKEKRMALEENRRLEEQLRLAAVEVAAKEREAAAKKAAEAQKATASLNVTVEIERSVLSTPVGKGAGLNVTVDLEKSPQSYSLTPKGGNKPTTSKTAEDYGMDQNSDDSTDDESAPRKPIPSWAEGHMLQQIIVKQYFNPPNFESFLGIIEPPKLEAIFNKKKPRYFKRTSSAVWHSPPHGRK